MSVSDNKNAITNNFEFDQVKQTKSILLKSCCNAKLSQLLFTLFLYVLKAFMRNEVCRNILIDSRNEVGITACLHG